MNHKFKMRQRVTALCMAAMMCCGMLPYGALAEDSARPVVVATPEQAAAQEAKSESDANSTATPETADESPDEDAPQQEPETEGDTGGSDELYEIWHKMYPSLTQEPTGYYLDSYGLPVLVGETKISIEGWGNEDYSSVSDDSFQQVALDAALLDADSTTAAFPHMDGEDYAIVPISMQVMYPANGSSADITLPDNVELLGYSFTSGDLTPATEEERQSQLHYEFSEISASVAGIYVKASEDFSVTMTYTDATQTLTKTVHVTLDDSAPVPGILQDRFAQETQVAMCSADEGIATYAGLQVTQCVNTSVGWMNYLGGQPALCGDRGKWAWGPGATYKNKYPPVANYTPAGQVWVEAEYFNKGWVPDQATLWSKGFNNGAPAVASLALDAADNATDNYLALLSWQAEQYPDSIAAEIVNAPEAYAAPTGKTVYVGTLYTPSNAAWQRFVVLNYTPVVLSGDSEIPGFETGGESVDKPWSASYERSESLDFSYTVNTDKIQLDTLEKVDGAGIEIAPILDGIPVDIDGGSWTITPDGMQSVTTSGHTSDDNYHLNGGDGSVTWTVHFSVSKSASQSGSITANSEQDADAQASAAQSAAQSACEGQVNGEIEAALSAAHNYFDKTAQSINVSLGLRMSAFNIPSIANICADDTIDLRELGSEKKVALFVVTPDTTTAYNFLAAVMFQQCFQILVDIADHRPDKRLPRHLRFLLDEFPNIGMIPDFQILISTIRSRDIACTLIYQSLNQLKSQYKDDWATIYENCDSMIVLGAGGNPENLEFFSKALGKATIEVMNTSENKGSQGSYTKSYQALGRELMTPEEIRTMPRNWCLLMISGVAPFYSRKYNLKDHPNYHLVEAEGGKPFDYDRRAEQSFADFISNVKDVKTVNLCAENNN